MDHFRYIEGELCAERLRVTDIADALGTPLYVYSQATLLDHYQRLREAFAPIDPLICFAVKSCSNLSILRLLGACGAGMDLVSGGELRRAQEAGIDPAMCVYAGVGKTDDEIRQALDAGLGWFNVESEPEFENIRRLARTLGVRCRAALRVNPDVDPKTHRYTTTGKKETKFGVDLERARAFFVKYGDDEWCRLAGIHLHIGSPVYTIEPYVESIEKALALIDDVEAVGNHRVTMLDLGGGFGADYESDQSPLASDYADRIIPLLEDRVKKGLRIVLEPGRTIAANAGVLVTTVQYVKQSGERRFIICDAGMNALLRPSHYEAFHFVWPARVAEEHVPSKRSRSLRLPGLELADVVGPVCESGDFLALDRALPPVERDDRIVVFGAGAYGMSMANQYNTFPRGAEVLVNGDQASVIREREQYDDLFEHEKRPRTVPITSQPMTGATTT